MAVYDSTNIKDPFYILRSQTPPNMVKQDYFLHELQEKVLADWPYRPNRCVIEKEKDFGEENYFPLEVVLQSVKNDKGTAISKDWVRVVYKNIREETRIGQRFRFSYDFDLCGPNKSKNIWIALNNNFITPTQSQVICRCNGNLAQIYTDENGNNLLHYEPVIQTTQLNQSFFQFSEIAIDPSGRLTIIAQKINIQINGLLIKDLLLALIVFIKLRTFLKRMHSILMILIALVLLECIWRWINRLIWTILKRVLLITVPRTSLLFQKSKRDTQ